jgi:hypothetical protein
VWWLGNPSPINRVNTGARVGPSAWVGGAVGPRRLAVQDGRFIQGLVWEHRKLWLHPGVI